VNQQDARGVVAAGHRLTAEAGADVLRAGGTALDAVIASIAMACVCEPVLCSPGGTGFAMVRDGASGATSVIDFFAQTPVASRQPEGIGVRAVHADFGPAAQAFQIGPATSATPGFFSGVEALHAAGATWSLGDLFAKAVGAARSGVRITPFQHYLSTVVRPILLASPAGADLFAPGGDLLAQGAAFRNPALADSLEILATDGFVDSSVGRECVGAQADEGHLTATDFASYTAIERPPVAVQVGESVVYMNPPPAASGALIAHSLRHLESPGPVDVARALQATGEARHAITLRQRGTTHVSVIDASGTACAVSVSNGEGNGELIGNLGFMLNNILGEEDVNPVGAVGWPVDTRLSTMMCPAIIESPGGGLVALGSGGSNRIRSAILQVIVELCLKGADLGAAIDAPRLHVEAEHLDFEDRYDHDVRAELCALFADHRAWPEPNLFFGGVHGTGVDPDGRFTGCGDPRRDGVSIAVSG
jgi:gamma-glutamyltranspeptidase/glutathione hydrolase